MKYADQEFQVVKLYRERLKVNLLSAGISRYLFYRSPNKPVISFDCRPPEIIIYCGKYSLNFISEVKFLRIAVLRANINMTDQDQSLHDLSARIIAGDDSAFRQLYAVLSIPLLDYAMSIVKDKEISEDIVQDIFTRIWLKRADLNPDLSIKAYLYRATRNAALNLLRHENIATQSEGSIQVFYYAPEMTDDLDEVNKKLEKAIGRLPNKCRTVFLMNKIDGLTYTEIAEILDISVNTVKTQMGRALSFLRGELINLR